MYSCTEFAQVATTDREDTISIFSRRVNTKRLTESSTTYSVLRSWVQDDPDRPPISVCTETQKSRALMRISAIVCINRSRMMTCLHLKK